MLLGILITENNDIYKTKLFAVCGVCVMLCIYPPDDGHLATKIY
jgi:hypothetical protein